MSILSREATKLRGKGAKFSTRQTGNCSGIDGKPDALLGWVKYMVRSIHLTANIISSYPGAISSMAGWKITHLV